MVFALSPQAEQTLVRGFSKHEHTRAYLAVVYGAVDGPRTIETNIVRDRGDGLRGSLPAGQTSPEAKPAVTHFKPVKRIGDFTTIECRLETGRTHQIRIHLSEIGHRLCGENVYTRPPGGEPLPDVSGAPRAGAARVPAGFVAPGDGAGDAVRNEAAARPRGSGSSGSKTPTNRHLDSRAAIIRFASPLRGRSSIG